MFLRSVISRLGTGMTTTAVKLVQTPRFVHTNLLSASRALILKPDALRPLGALRHVHDTKAKGDDELVSFLTEEIATEKKNQRGGALPTSLEGFEVQLDQSEITFSKKFNNEKVMINLNVNHTVDADYSEEMDPAKAPQQPGGEKDAAEMRSRPNFEVEISKGSKILSFSCSYLQDPGTADPQQEEYQDAFVIDEISVYEGEGNDQTYAVAGDILDGYLYDLFMNMLEERGITNEFVEKMSDFATDYEHKLYINLLGQLQGFLSSK